MFYYTRLFRTGRPRPWPRQQLYYKQNKRLDVHGVRTCCARSGAGPTGGAAAAAAAAAFVTCSVPLLAAAHKHKRTQGAARGLEVLRIEARVPPALAFYRGAWRLALFNFNSIFNFHFSIFNVHEKPKNKNKRRWRYKKRLEDARDSFRVISGYTALIDARS